ncbi:MAG: hypothetical protein JNL29_08895 [Nitrospira sp.]|nr:hypothetical protein [Nitrospira sp.]
MTSLREEGGDGRHNATWPIRPTDAGVGFSSVLLTDFFAGRAIEAQGVLHEKANTH